MASKPEGAEQSSSPLAIYGHVAVCVDHSEVAHDAIALGQALAGDPGRISLVHATEITSQLNWVKMLAVPDLDWVPIGTELLESLSESVPDAETVLLKGHPTMSIVDWVEEARPDVVVCAAHHGLAARTVAGSICTYFAYRLPCPVAIARPGVERPRRFRRVAACVDADGQAEPILDTAERIADAHLAELTAVHVMDDLTTYGHYGWTPDPMEWHQEWQRELAAIVGERRCAQVLLHGNFAGAVIGEWAADEEIDLLVAAAHRSGLERFFLGGFASHLAHNAPCDVLIGR